MSTTTTTPVPPAEKTTIKEPAVTPTLPPVAANPGWRHLQAAPLAGRVWHPTTWTSRELMIWGGVFPTTGTSYDDGAIFDTSGDEWRLMPLFPLEGRVGHTAVWTGGEVIVWGGHSGGTDGKPTRRFSDGAAFQPSTDTWRAIATPDLAGGPGYASVWTGSEVIVIGGNDGNQSFAENGLNEAGAYDLSTDTWRPLEMPVELTVLDVIWTGTEVVVYGVSATSLPAERSATSR